MDQPLILQTQPIKRKMKRLVVARRLHKTESKILQVIQSQKLLMKMHQIKMRLKSMALKKKMLLIIMMTSTQIKVLRATSITKRVQTFKKKTKV